MTHVSPSRWVTDLGVPKGRGGGCLEDLALGASRTQSLTAKTRSSKLLRRRKNSDTKVVFNNNY